MNNIQSYPHDSLKQAEAMVPAITITDTVNFAMDHLKNIILPIFEKEEDFTKVIHDATLPYAPNSLTLEDINPLDPFTIKNFKEAQKPRLDLLNLDEFGKDGLPEQDTAIVARNILKHTAANDSVTILLTANTIARLEHKLQALLLSLFTEQDFFDIRFKSISEKKSSLKPLCIVCSLETHTTMVTKLKSMATWVRTTFTGICYARLLGNLPANIANPAYFKAETEALTSAVPELTANCYDETFLQANNMNALLAVASGSKNSPYMTVLEYAPCGTKQEAPICVIGKGLTFDSGGLSLKPGAQMDEMMFDKCGATAVFGIMYTAARLGLHQHLVGLASFVENMPDGSAYRPGDIITTRSGRTVEVLNTDAEGRMVLCDTISYAVDTFNPQLIIDIATLTGACMVALGHDTTGFFLNGAAERLGLASKVRESSQRTGDASWQLPTGRLFGQMIEARFGDLANTGGRYAGAVTAAEFLKCFAEKKPWMHLDVAGTAWISGNKKNATGRPVAMVSELLSLMLSNS